jgi:hypothetical protein
MYHLNNWPALCAEGGFSAPGTGKTARMRNQKLLVLLLATALPRLVLANPALGGEGSVSSSTSALVAFFPATPALYPTASAFSVSGGSVSFSSDTSRLAWSGLTADQGVVGRMQPATMPGLDPGASIVKPVTLPSGPGGSTLAISGLLTLGGWRLVRSARQGPGLSLPDWYCAAAAAQIGHMVVYRLDSPALVPLAFESPTPFKPNVLPRRQTTPVGRLSSQATLLSSVPRGPPPVA